MTSDVRAQLERDSQPELTPPKHFGSTSVASPFFSAVLTPAALNSYYVLFELGARWGVDMFHVPLFAKGVGPGVIKEPLNALNCMRLDNEESVFQLIDDIGRELKTSLEPADAYHKKVLLVVALASASKGIDKQIGNTAKSRPRASQARMGKPPTTSRQPPVQRSNNDIVSAVQIAKMIKDVPFVARAALGRRFEGTKVCWDLWVQQLLSGNWVDVRLRMSPNRNTPFPQVFCDLRREDCPFVENLREGTFVRVAGEIKSASDVQIDLAEVDIELLSAPP